MRSSQPTSSRAYSSCAQTINDNVAERQFYGLSHINRLKEMLLAFMISRGFKKLEGDKATIGLQVNSTPSLVIDNPARVDERFFEKSFRFTKTELQEVVYQLSDGELRRRLYNALQSTGWEISASAVRLAISSNSAVPGASLVKGHHVRLR